MKQNDGQFSNFNSIESVMPINAIDMGQVSPSRTKVEDSVDKTSLFALSSITDKDLREALAPFDVDGNGVIDLVAVRKAAKGNLHWSDDRPMVGLAEHVKQVNHLAILVSDVSRSLKFYSQVMGFEQIRRCVSINESCSLYDVLMCSYHKSIYMI